MQEQLLKEIKKDLESVCVADITQTKKLIHYIIDSEKIEQDTFNTLMRELEYERQIEDLKLIEIVLIIHTYSQIVLQTKIPSVKKDFIDRYNQIRRYFQREPKLQIYFNELDSNFK